MSKSAYKLITGCRKKLQSCPRINAGGGRWPGESEYLQIKYSEIPDLLSKIGKNPSDPVAPL